MNWLIDETENEFIIKIKQLNLKKENFKLVRFGDYFKQVKKTVNYSYTSTGENTGIYPLYSCKKCDKGIAKYVSNPEYIPKHGVLVIVRTRNATCGYCNYCFNPLAWISSSVYVYKPRFNGINLFVTSMILTRTISPKHLNIDTFNNNQLENRNVFIYLDDTNVLSSEFKIVGVIPKLKIDRTKIRKIKFSDYFEKVKPRFNINNLNNLCKGPFPHFGARNQDKPDCYVNVYNYEDNNLIRLSRITGHCYVQNGNCAVNNNCLCYRLKNNTLNLSITSLLLTNQFKKVYNYARPLNVLILQTTECYVYFN